MPRECRFRDPEFENLIRIIAGKIGIDPALIEKDGIMHCLSGLQRLGYKFELKGGTSLFKGFKFMRGSTKVGTTASPRRGDAAARDASHYRVSDRARSSMRGPAMMSLLAGLGRCRFALARFAFRNFKSSASKKLCLTRMRAGASRTTRSQLSTLTRSDGVK
jgi:hypothetical protein